jgi:tryptophan-rich sensory protein
MTAPTRRTPASLLPLIGWLALTAAAAAIGAAASVDAGPFYLGLDRPGWAPPAGVFGPVWSALYLTMAIAAWLVWRTPPSPARRAAVVLFVAQLAANALWSWLFFGWRLGALAFAEVLVLLALVAATAAAFWRVRPLAGALLVPYLAWVAFASVLTWAVWTRNPAALGWTPEAAGCASGVAISRAGAPRRQARGSAGRRTSPAAPAGRQERPGARCGRHRDRGSGRAAPRS